MLEYSVETLDTGLTVIRVPMPAVPSATVLVLTNTGSRYEVEKQYGVAHFFEHMVFKGTDQFTEARDLAAAIDAVGANFNAFTSKEYTGYYVKAASQHLDLAVDVVSDMLMTPKLRKEDIEREKGVIIEELNMYADTPARHISDLFEQLAYRGTGLEHSIIGSKDTIRGMQRADFVSFLDEWYQLGNMVVIIAGDAAVVDRKETLETVKKAFSKGARGGGTATQKQPVRDDLKKTPVSGERLLVEHKQTEQAHIVMGWPGLKRSDTKRYALSLLATILGGNMSSRLFTEVREKRGLCYYVHSDIDQYHDGGIFGASAGVDQSRVEEAIQVIREQFELIAHDSKHAVEASELAQAQDYIAGKMVLGLEDSEAVAQFFGMKHLLLDEIHSPDEVLKKYQAVTLEEVRQIAAELVTEQALKLAVIGPYEDASVFEKLIS